MRFSDLVSEGTALTRELRRIGGQSPKLSRAGFIEEACTLSGMTEAELATILDTARESGILRSFLTIFSRELRTERWPRLPGDEGQILRALRLYAPADLQTAMADAGIIPRTLIALAAVQATRDGADHEFGSIDRWSTYADRESMLRARLGEIEQSLTRTWAARHVTIGPATDNERAGGLMRVNFRRWPSLSPAQETWPRAALDIEADREEQREAEQAAPAASAPAEPEPTKVKRRERARLAGASASAAR